MCTAGGGKLRGSYRNWREKGQLASLPSQPPTHAAAPPRCVRCGGLRLWCAHSLRLSRGGLLERVPREDMLGCCARVRG